MNLLPNVKTVYYVNGTIGNDNNTGKAPTKAFKTMAHAMIIARTCDVVLLKCKNQKEK